MQRSSLVLLVAVVLAALANGASVLNRNKTPTYAFRFLKYRVE